jgi:Na+/H+-dicarboxylate symporter
MSIVSKSSPSVLTLCLAVAAGLGCGLFIKGISSPAAATVLFALDSIIRAWTNGLRAVVLPLIVAQLFLAIGAHGLSARRSGRLSLAVAMVFAALLMLTAMLTLLAVSGMLRLPVLASLALPATSGVQAAAAAVGGNTRSWVDGFVPSNIVAAASGDNILPVMLFTCLFALAARRASASTESLGQLARAIGDTSFVLLRWLMAASPVVVFALTCRMTNDVGLRVGEVVLWFVVVESIALAGCLAALYPLATLLGRTGFVPFARAAAPAQVAALTTRSSLATVPSLMLSCDKVLGLSPDITASVIPLAGATLKLSRAVSNTTKLLFLAHVLGIPLSPGQVAVFTATVLLMSPSTPGLPTVTSASRSLPAYVAAGIPAEYVVLLSATTWMTDMLMTVLNSTGYLASAVLVQRVVGRGSASSAGRRPTAAALPSTTLPGRLGDEG